MLHFGHAIDTIRKNKRGRFLRLNMRVIGNSMLQVRPGENSQSSASTSQDQRQPCPCVAPAGCKRMSPACPWLQSDGAEAAATKSRQTKSNNGINKSTPATENSNRGKTPPSASQSHRSLNLEQSDAKSVINSIL